jgi:ATP-dependent Clp endopeptidase proteolytic subunit ClpP
MTQESNTTPEATPATTIEQLRLLQIEKAQLELIKGKRIEAHETLFHVADLRRIVAVAEMAELDLARKKRDSDREMALAGENLTYTFYDGVDAESVKRCLAALGTWSRRFPGKAMTIVLNSTGGGVNAGLALYDYILKLRADGHHITVVALGVAASMGGVLLQAGDKRVIGKFAQVLIHEVSSATSGNINAMEDRLAYSKRLWEQCSEILAERSKLTVTQLRKRALRKDWWLNADEAVALGFADEILSAPAPFKVKKGLPKTSAIGADKAPVKKAPGQKGPG